MYVVKQKTAYEMRISDWSSDVCSSDLTYNLPQMGLVRPYVGAGINYTRILKSKDANLTSFDADHAWAPVLHIGAEANINRDWFVSFDIRKLYLKTDASGFLGRSEEHTSELQSLMRISYAVFCLKKKNT